MKIQSAQRGERQALIIGKRLCLRKVRLDDAEGPYLSWMNDPETLQYTESRFEPWSKERLQSYIAEINKNPQFIFLAITLRDSGRHIGNIKLGPIGKDSNGDLVGDVGFIIGAKECWGQGYAAESIQLLADYAFSPLKLDKVTASCYAVNIAAIKTLKKAGFEQLKKNDKYPSRGKLMDTVWFHFTRPHHG
jgi:RimJ/RimL family protein N-acetyltransferase